MAKYLIYRFPLLEFYNRPYKQCLQPKIVMTYKSDGVVADGIGKRQLTYSFTGKITFTG